MRVVDQMRMLDQHVPRKIEDGRFDRVARYFLKLEESGSVGDQRLMDWSLGRKDRQMLVCAYHRPLDEKAVDPAGILDRIGQAAARLEVERQGTGAEVNVEIEES